jgi:hypothetical protein
MLADLPLETELPGVLKGLNVGAHARQYRVERHELLTVKVSVSHIYANWSIDVRDCKLKQKTIDSGAQPKNKNKARNTAKHREQSRDGGASRRRRRHPECARGFMSLAVSRSCRRSGRFGATAPRFALSFWRVNS